MTVCSDTIVLVRFRRPPDDATLRLASEALGKPRPDDAKVRLFDPGLLMVQCENPPNSEELETLRSLETAAGVRVLKPGERLGGLSENRPFAPVRVGESVVVGGRAPVVMAGPCSVEGHERMVNIAKSVKKAGADMLRGGAFKPRTSPYSFGGLGEKGLEALAEVRRETGLPFVTEVLDAEFLDLVAEKADMLQIGSRNMQNTPLLFRVGAHPSGKPVLLKRGFGATFEEWLEAAEYVLLGRFFAGHEEPGVVLCERGIRSFEHTLRFTLDVGAIAEARAISRLPVIADPSHAAGRRDRVPALALAAQAAGSDGLLVEVHDDPDTAWSDAAQCLDPEAFEKLMRLVRAVAKSLPTR